MKKLCSIALVVGLVLLLSSATLQQKQYGRIIYDICDPDTGAGVCLLQTERTVFYMIRYVDMDGSGSLTNRDRITFRHRVYPLEP